jgi:hypothetical protein
MDILLKNLKIKKNKKYILTNENKKLFLPEIQKKGDLNFSTSLRRPILSSYLWVKASSPQLLLLMDD